MITSLAQSLYYLWHANEMFGLRERRDMLPSRIKARKAAHRAWKYLEADLGRVTRRLLELEIRCGVNSSGEDV